MSQNTDSVEPVGTLKGYERNPGNYFKSVGNARLLNGVSIEAAQGAIRRLSSNEFMIRHSTAGGFKGVVVNILCKRSTVDRNEVEDFLDQLNMALNAMRKAREEAAQQNRADHPAGGNQQHRDCGPRTVRVASQQRSG